MKVRAVIFDIYKTLLDVAPPPSDAEDRWNKLLQSTFGGTVRITLEKFGADCERIIGRENANAREMGIIHPEVYWPDVTREALLELAQLSTEACDDFLYRHAQLQRTVRLMNGAGEALTQLSSSNLLLGIASNSQPYTLRELDSALTTANLSAKMFRDELAFYSFDCGFSKPNPHAFRILTARLKSLGISPEEILMVGDRLDNDIAPARAAGWQTWHLNGPAGSDAGDWSCFLAKRTDLLST